jgi:hypothetical protein
VAGSNDPSSVDLYFENFLSSGEFSVGKIVSLNFEVPINFPLGTISGHAIPDTFDNGATIPTTGGSFSVHIVPEPSTILLLSLGTIGFAGFFWHRRD